MRIIIWGATGQMGKLACQAVIESGHELAGQVSQDLKQLAPADVIIDFSSGDGIVPLLDYALAEKLPVVVATTGHNEEQQAYIQEASRSIAILQSPNFSLGMNLLIALVEDAARVLQHSDIEIMETHHRRKQDAPSGSAKELLAAIERALGARQAVNGRSGIMVRQPQEVGMHAIRGGNIVGEHTVNFFTASETLTLTHTAHDRSVYATGAICAAEFLCRQAAGYYTMRDLLEI